MAACAAVIIALARPCGDAGTRTEKSLGRNVLIALDLSRSMRVRDVKPDRLAQAKLVIYELLDAMPNERIGLLGFAGDAYPYAPLTIDRAAVRETVEQIDESWVPLGGSNMAAAVQRATDILKKTGQKNNALVILSDGEENAGKLNEMIYEARQSGVFILAIGVGTEDGDYVPNSDFKGNRMVDRDAKPVVSRLHADVMRKLATETKGRYAVAGSGADIPAMVKTAIKDLDAFELNGRERVVSIEFYQWLLLPAILFLMISIVAGTRWRGVRAAMAFATLSLTPITARADEVSAAKQALDQKQYPAARDAYQKLAEHSRLKDRRTRYRLGEATAAYRNADFNNARSAYSQALLSENPKVLEAAHLGMGSSLFQLGWQDLTGSAYPEDSSQLKDFSQFDQSVRKRLAESLKPQDNDAAESPVAKSITSVITNWTDAVRHNDSALAIDPHNRTAISNKRGTLAYLKRLEELLREEREKTEQSMPTPKPDATPRPDEQGDNDPEKQPKDKSDDKSSKPPGEKSDKDAKNPKDGTDDKDQNPEDKSEKKKDGKESGKRPEKDSNKTPEEQARDILMENADLEKGPLSPGRREFRKPEKDW